MEDLLSMVCENGQLFATEASLGLWPLTANSLAVV